MKKGIIGCRMDIGDWKHVNGYIMSDQWGIHKDFDNTRYVLTHLLSGRRVWSSKKQITLKRLIQEPEFLERLDFTSSEHRAKLSKAIKRFCEENGWE